MLIGLPFAAQADVFAFRPVAYPTPPRSWADTLTGSDSFLFPAGDPRSEFTLAQHLSAGGTLRDAEGDPALDAVALQHVLEFTPPRVPAGYCLCPPDNTKTAVQPLKRLPPGRSARRSCPSTGSRNSRHWRSASWVHGRRATETGHAS